MKIVNIYVVTYNNEANINENIRRFLETTGRARQVADLRYHIINNHTTFKLNPEYEGFVEVFHNWLRPNHSCGHLSRDYNMGLLHGFQNLNNPASNQVILLHDDSIWCDNWFEDLEEIHKTYTFYAGDWGDGLTSYLPEAVRKIGMWDERFCNIGYHEADYFLRAAIYNRDKSTINDAGAGRVLNKTKEIFYHAEPNHNKMASHDHSAGFHGISYNMFLQKWAGFSPVNWNLNSLPSQPTSGNCLFYPYFEDAIENR